MNPGKGADRNGKETKKAEGESHQNAFYACVVLNQGNSAP